MLFDILKAIAAKEKSTELPAVSIQHTAAPGIAQPATPDQAAPSSPEEAQPQNDTARPPRKPAEPRGKTAHGERAASAQAAERAPGRPAALNKPQPLHKARPQGAKRPERERTERVDSPAPRVTQPERPRSEIPTAAPSPLPPAAGPVVRYMHPANRHLTWDGEGEQPDWVTAYLAHGGSWTAMENTAQKLAGQRRNPLEG